MPFETPTLPELIKRAKEDLQGDALEQSDAQVLARVHAGALFSIYGYMQWIVKQILPDTADEAMLERQANLRIGGRKQPTQATGSVQVTGTSGAFLPEGTVLQSASGNQYTTVEAVTLDGTTATASVVSTEKGSAMNLDAGETLRLVSPVASIQDEVTVVDPGITGGSDLESVEDLRDRVIRSYQIIPCGGDADDYVTWALEVEGITRAWCIPNHMGAGTVGVFCVRDDDDPITPDEQELQDVKDHIDSVRPVTANVYVKAPTLKTVNYTISVTPDSAAVRTAVQAALSNLIDSEGDLGGTIYLSHIRAAVSGATGETDNTVISPTSDVTCAETELPVMGQITWS